MKKIVNICPYIYYRNEQFMKDCILLPYTFQKVYDFQTVIVTAKREEYTYLQLLPGLQVEIIPAVETMEQWIAFACSYVKQAYEEIDILFCFGSYDTNKYIIPLYKKLRPGGIVILKLDINIIWADRLTLSDSKLQEMYESCDLITCESKRMKKYLSEKWPYRIDYVVNGYMDDIASHYGVRYDEKENTIITVGRLGTQQKANHILVEAFARCAHRHPKWLMKLVGSIEPDFQKYMDEFYIRYPKLVDRVILAGKILDRKQLNEEYRKAKVFAMTSLMEGGTPNVFSEAASNGCYIISSDIEAIDEMTNWGKCGRSFPINDIDSLTEVLDEVLNESYEAVLQQACGHIQEYHRRYFDYKKMVKKMMHLLELEEKVELQEWESGV